MKDRFREFYESVAKKYPEDRIIYQTLSGHLRKKWITSKLQEFPEGSLLDCGCNIGTLSRYWRKGSVFGIDIAYAVLEQGRKLSPDTNFLQVDLRDMSMFHDESINNAMACEVIEHLDKTDSFFENLYRAMKNGGHVLVTSPNFTSSRPEKIPLGILRSFGVNQGTEGDKYLHTAYRPHELAEMAERVGYRVLEQGSFEFELRGWMKPITVLRLFLNTITMARLQKSRMYYLIERSYNKLEIDLFFILDTFNFGCLLKKLFKEGRRSYIVAKK